MHTDIKLIPIKSVNKHTRCDQKQLNRGGLNLIQIIFKNSIISGPLNLVTVIRKYFLRRSIYHRSVSANLSLSMIQKTTPSQLVLKFFWESKRPAKSDFALGERKKSLLR
jgi:hypothetical protein